MGSLIPQVVRTLRGPIEVATAGSGPTLLVVHGMPGDWRQARVLVDDLASVSRVILVTRPGYGRTPLRSGRTPVAQAALYAALLDSLGVESAVVLGISGGGPSAHAFAALHSTRCVGLVLACPVRSDVIVAPVVMRRLAAVPGVWSALSSVARLSDAWRRSRGLPPPSDPAGLTDVERELLEDPYVREAADVFEAERTRTMRGRGLCNDTRRLGDPSPSWSGAAIPTVVLHGDLDAVVPLENGEAHAAAVPGARMVVLPGLGHGVPVFARTQLVAELRAMLTP